MSTEYEYEYWHLRIQEYEYCTHFWVSTCRYSAVLMKLHARARTHSSSCAQSAHICQKSLEAKKRVNVLFVFASGIGIAAPRSQQPLDEIGWEKNWLSECGV